MIKISRFGELRAFLEQQKEDQRETDYEFNGGLMASTSRRIICTWAWP